MKDPALVESQTHTRKAHDDRVKEWLEKTNSPLDWGISDASTRIDETIARQ